MYDILRKLSCILNLDITASISSRPFSISLSELNHHSIATTSMDTQVLFANMLICWRVSICCYLQHSARQLTWESVWKNTNTLSPLLSLDRTQASRYFALAQKTYCHCCPMNECLLIGAYNLAYVSPQCIFLFD